MHTIDEAKKLRCGEVPLSNLFHCLADGCSHWRWLSMQLVSNEHGVGSTLKLDTIYGYCGKSGAPRIRGGI